ncbi:MAG: metallophosphoesterase family protein [Deltaproteobacteria bacterium]|nr:metallophosphoesterase family protein [Deltaproteobacteria bacterium]
MSITVGVLSDTHLRRVTKDFRYIYEKYLSGVDIILHAGDFTSPDIVSFLGKKDFHGVHGNMDPVEVKLMLPEKEEIDIGGHRVGLVHGWGPSEGLVTNLQTTKGKGFFFLTRVLQQGFSHRVPTA